MDQVVRQAQQLFQDFILTYLVERDKEKTLTFFDDSVCRIGTGRMEYAANKQDLKKLFDIEFDKDTIPYTVQWENIFTKQADENCFYVTAFFTVSKQLSNGETYSLQTRGTCFICRNGQGNLKIFGLHCSAPLAYQNDNEFYPILYGEGILHQKLSETTARLHNKNKELEEITQNVLCGVIKCTLNEPCSLLYVSDGFCKLTGYSQTELIQSGHCCFDLISEQHRQDVREKIYCKKQDKDSWDIPLQMEYCIHTKDEKELWMIERVRIIEENGCCYRYGVITDISEIHKVNQDLQDLASNIPGGVCRIRLDEDLTLLYGNDGFYHLFGYSKHQMKLELGNRLIAAIHQVDIPSIVELMERVLQSGKSFFEFENRIFRRDGTLVWLLTKGNLTKCDNEIIMNCVVLDITERKRMEQELSINEERMRIALAQTSNIVFDFDISLKTIMVSQQLAEIYHIPRIISNVPDSLAKLNWIGKEYLQDVRRIFERIIDGEPTATCEIKSENNKWTKITLTSVFSEMGRPIRAIGVLEDITVQRQAEIAFAKEEQYRRAMLLDTQAYVEINLSQNMVEKSRGTWNNADEVNTIGDYEKLLDGVVRTMVHSEDAKAYGSIFSRENLIESYYMGKTEIQMEHRRKNIDGNMIWMQVTIHLVKDLDTGDLKGIAYLKDIDRRKQEELILQYQSKRDILTGLYNKGAAEGLIKEMLAGAIEESRHALILVDIDDFKRVNENRGHLFGDRLLCCIARKIREMFCFDDIIARTGGDEFMIFMKDVFEHEDIHKKAAAIGEVVRQFSKAQIPVSCSIGVSVYPKDGRTYEELYQSTDIALYEAKTLRCNHAVFYSNEIAYKNHMNIGDTSLDYTVKLLENKLPYQNLIITESEKKNNFDSEKSQILLDSVRSMTFAVDLEDAANAVLKAITEFYQAEGAYVFEMDMKKKCFVCQYEWFGTLKRKTAEGLWKAHDMYLVWERMFPENQLLELHDIEGIKNSRPILYDEFKKYNITSFYAVPYEMVNLTKGFIAVENIGQNKDIYSFMESLSYFFINEMTKRKLNHKFEYMSYHDLLTGLPNRNSYEEYLNTMSEMPPESIGIMLADINGLKELNDSYGSKQGDLAIVGITDIFKKYFDEHFVFRLDGDEFVIFCVNVTLAEFQNKMKKAKDEIAVNASRSVSTGYSWEKTDIDLPQLIQHAHERMLISKQEYYKNNTSLNNHYRPKALKELRTFIKERYFEVYLQPQIEIETGKAVSAEALIRLNHPTSGIITPGKFIPQLEQNKLIRFIDFFMFEEVCKILESWKKANYKLCPVSVNFSRITLLESDLMAMLFSIIEKYDIPHDMIEVEITETIGEMETETLAEIGSNFQKAGFRIALDDFGTRYTSITMLTIMKFDVLKLDRSLVLDLVNNEGNRIVVQSILDMCQRMGIHTVAEGVETEEQKELLKKFGCHLIQGYFYSRPLQRKVFEEKYMEKI